MRPLICLLFIFFIKSALAREVVSQIHDIDQDPTQETLIYLKNGMILKVAVFEKILVKDLTSHLIRKNLLKINFNNERYINTIEVITSINSTSHNRKFKFTNSSIEFRPSILSNLDEARSHFYDARQSTKESQCFNRAHTWAYEWRIKRNLYSSKAWLFFTKRYIRKYKFEWWFHVAPMIYVIIDNQVKERIMDVKYAKGPIKLKKWTDIFIRDNSDCPVVSKYSEQADHPESSNCYIMKSSMYYYQPVDLEQLELTGVEKNVWIESEVKQAFLDALEIEL